MSAVPDGMEEYVKAYKDASGQKWMNDHLYTLINRAYLSLRRTGKDQSIILNGFDDKSKQIVTEATIEYLCKLTGPVSPSKSHDKVALKLSSAMTILNAFTCKSITESCLLIDCNINAKGRLVGAQFHHFLLPHLVNESRSCLIFHALATGADHQLKKDLHLSSPSLFNEHQPSDKYLFHDVNEALQSLGMSEKSIHHIFQLVAAISHLTTIEFDYQENDTAQIKNKDHCELVASMLGLPCKSLETTLLVKQTKIGNEYCSILLDVKAAEEHKYVLIESLYHHLTLFLFNYINKKCSSSKSVNSLLIVNPMIPIMSKRNDLNQLLSNEFNELLINQFTTTLFSQLELFNQEGLKFDQLEIKTNDNQLQLLLNKDHGLNQIISTSQSVTELITTMTAEHVDNPCFIEATTQSIQLVHSFGTTTYDARQLLHTTDIDDVQMVNGSADFGSSTNPLLLKAYATSPPVSNLEQLETIAALLNKQPWFVLCLSDKKHMKPYQLVTICKQLQSTNDMSHYISYRNFIDRYRDVLRSYNIDESTTPKQQTLSYISTSAPSTKSPFYAGSHSLLLNGHGWQQVEFQSRKLKASGALNDMDLLAARMDMNTVYSDTSDTLSDYSEQSSDVETLASTVDLAAEKEYELEEVQQSGQRKKWVCCTWCLTWWIPTFMIKCCGMNRADVQMAWREKVALVLIILIMCACMLFFIAGLGPLICPRQDILSLFELQFKNTADEPFVSVYGRIVSIEDLIKVSPAQHNQDQIREQYGGLDITPGFPRTPATYCTFVQDKSLKLDIDAKDISKVNGTAIFSSHASLYQATSTDGDPRSVGEQRMDNFITNKKYLKFMLGWDPQIVKDQLTDKFLPRQMVIVNEQVYDLTVYLSRIGDSKYRFLGDQLTDYLNNNAGSDITSNSLFMNQWNSRSDLRDCFNNLFLVGVVDKRKSFKCQFSNYLLLAASIVLVSIIGFKFLAALQLGSQREPEEHDKFVILQMPCYTEGEENLKKTLDALASLQYDDKRKLLFIVCDGMIVGSGNDRPTPRIVLDILGVDPHLDPEPLSFQSIGQGSKQHNMGKVYTGLYDIQGHLVPFLVIVKVGQQERVKPGNRGKRDSQMILMRFLNKVYYDTPMSPLELEMYHQIKHVIGVSPSFYEYVLMVDADTIPMHSSLNRMISAMIHDTKIAGCCGETKLSNEKQSWATMIQVYEYYISHHMAKAFESLFGSVTCLPGCFCMYRLRSPLKNTPLLIANQIIKDYGDCNVDTLHKKNLLSLGEDRYLTTIMLKHFPYHKMVFTQDAQCTTSAPDRWTILLSQRRRWINSTVHNLAELVNLPQLCGFCCFSMRFVVFIDLFATLVQPAAVCYLVYLMYVVIDASIRGVPSPIPLISLVLLGAIYGLQALIFIIKREWQHLGWMVVYILAIPIFSFFLPLYSFWHFDDFSWGTTRIVVGENGKKQIYMLENEKFHIDEIPHKRFSEYEQELWELEQTETSSDIVPRSPVHTHAMQSMQSMQPMQSMGSMGSMSMPVSQPSLLDDMYMEIEKIIHAADLMTMTKKQVRDELSRRMGMDVSQHREYINKSIDQILGV